MHDLTQGPIVVTGGAGLIGSALICALNQRGIDDIIVVDRLDRSEKWRHLVPLRFADYVDADDFELRAANAPDAFGKVATVFHLGACSSTTETDADYLIRNNYEYTKALARWTTETNARLVYASSAATYGALEENLSDQIDIRTLRPLNMYAYSKQLFDLYALRTGLLARIAGLKYFNVFGPNEDHKGDMRSIVFKAFHQIQETGSVRLFKSYRPKFAHGEQRRDFIYVKDAVEMTLYVAQSGLNGIVNIGTGTASTWLDLVRPIFTALNVPERIDFVDMPEGLREKYQYLTCARVERIRASGYSRPVTPLAAAVHDYIVNYLLANRPLDPADQERETPVRS
jgi:ADP-L-glycero-D-manno-heptose 6-epimerase